jgi:hypothetical protein
VGSGPPCADTTPRKTRSLPGFRSSLSVDSHAGIRGRMGRRDTPQSLTEKQFDRAS